SEPQIQGASAGSGHMRWAMGDEDRPDILARLRQARGHPLPPPAEEDSGPGRSLVDLLDPEFSLDLGRMDVAFASDEGEAEVARDLTLKLSRTEGGFHFEGRGEPADGGVIRWDLNLHPEELRAEGNVRFQGVPLALVVPFLPDVPWHEPELAELDGDLELEADGAEAVVFRGGVAVRNAGLYSVRISPEPIRRIAVAVDGAGSWSPVTRRLTLDEAQVRMGEASVNLSGSLLWEPERYVVDLTAIMPVTDCNLAVGAIPRDLLGGLEGFSWNGNMGGRVRAFVDSAALDETHLDLDVHTACEFETVPVMASLARVEGPFLHRVREPDDTWFEMTTGPGTGAWSSIYAISPFLVHAVLAHEDASFFRHSGFAPWAIRDALVRNLEEGRFVYGASTITMQLVKNLFLHREKHLARKVQEVLLTWWLESALEKKHILELYLNVIEYGPGVYGIRQGAHHYFGRRPEELSPAESAFLASILPAPKVHHSHYERGSLSSSMRNRVQRLLRHMASRGRIDQEALDYGLAELGAFRFRSDGAGFLAGREIPGSAATLPYGAGGTIAAWPDDWNWDDDDPTDDSDFGPEEGPGG
ncbi:MAG: transglycosylase domain-containing protein, partial [Myxococcota bacterium]